MRAGWVVSIVVGLVAGGFLFHFPGSYGAAVVSLSAAVFGFVLGAANGLIVGAVAWAVLRLPRRAGRRLVAATALLVGVTHSLNDGAAVGVPFFLVEAIAGVAAAGVAAGLLGERRPVTLVVVGLTWTVGIVLGASSGSLIGLPWTETPLGWAQDHAWDGLVTGLVWGGATAVVGLPDQLLARPAAGGR